MDRAGDRAADALADEEAARFYEMALQASTPTCFADKLLPHAFFESVE